MKKRNAMVIFSRPSRLGKLPVSRKILAGRPAAVTRQANRWWYSARCSRGCSTDVTVGCRDVVFEVVCVCCEGDCLCISVK